MNEEIRNLLVKADGENGEALDAVSMLINIYTYGLYGEKKDPEAVKIWSGKAKALEQKLSGFYTCSQKEKTKNIKTGSVKRFDNIKNNLRFVNTKDNIDDKHINRKERFYNIQNNLKFVVSKDKKQE